MSPLFETIKLKNGKLYNLSYHNLRFNNARKAYFGVYRKLALEEIITIPAGNQEGIFRCKVTYSPDVEKVEFIPHQPRKVSSLKLVEMENIDYQFKYTNRSQLDKLYSLRGKEDDILIIKNGFITDSYAANALFFDGLKWWTPDTPLLQGTQRERLLHEGKIHELTITPENLQNFKKVGLINALWDMDDMPVIGMGNVSIL